MTQSGSLSMRLSHPLFLASSGRRLLSPRFPCEPSPQHSILCTMYSVLPALHPSAIRVTSGSSHISCAGVCAGVRPAFTTFPAVPGSSCAGVRPAFTTFQSKVVNAGLTPAGAKRCEQCPNTVAAADHDCNPSQDFFCACLHRAHRLCHAPVNCVPVAVKLFDPCFIIRPRQGVRQSCRQIAISRPCKCITGATASGNSAKMP